ncbi:periplasmic sugar-binding protein [Actinobacillus equuli]|nr:periplasmic sugar-binding protein [Actinobacillus equuli]
MLNDAAGQGKAVVQLAANLAEGKAAGEGTSWKLRNVLYVFLMLA